MIWKIAWKNIWRNKSRSLVVIIAITLGLTGGIFTSALMLGMSQQKVTSAIQNEVSHIQIHNPLFLENTEIQYTIENADSIVDEIKKLPEVKAVCQRTKTTAMASTARTGTGIIVLGINPEEEKTVSGIYKTIADTNGTYFGTKKRNPIVIGKKLAKELNAKLRSKIVLSFQAIDGSLIYSAFRVVGIYKTKNSLFDETTVFIKNKDFLKLTGLKKASTHEIAIILYNEGKTLTEFSNKLKTLFPKLNIMTWKTIEPGLGMIADIYDAILYVFLIIILLALCFGIINTMLMSVLERVKEIGMLMAIGMSKTRIFKMIMLETVFLAFTGGIAGMIISFFLVNYFGKVGINLSMFEKAWASFGFDSYIYPKINATYYITITIMVVLTGIFASIYPAKKALSLNPVDALKTE